MAKAEGLAQDEGLFAVFDLRHDFSTEWTRFAAASATPTERTMSLGRIMDRLPYVAVKPDVIATDIYIFDVKDGSPDLQPTEFKLVPTGVQGNSFSKSVVADIPCIAITGVKLKCDEWTLSRTSAEALNPAWLLVRLQVPKQP